MNDRDIRAVLVNYLLAQSGNIRIYQEKAVGESICDIMVVSSCLTGYEIKSDLDNYTRLERQIKAYDKYFDRCYLVIGGSHRKKSSDKIPTYWGLICITQDKVKIIREASPNEKVSRRSQLGILWRAELRNILIRNNMPMFAQKNKSYIVQKITAYVSDSLLLEQITHELMYRDYSEYLPDRRAIDSKNNTKLSGLEQLIELVAEDDIGSITLDKWIELFSKAKETSTQRKSALADMKVTRAPHTIPYTDIEVSMGAPWISAEIIDEFVKELLNINVDWKLIEYEPVSGVWNVNNKKQFGHLTSCTAKYGIPRYNALYIIEATFNLREIKLFDEGNIYAEQDTVAALEKQQLIISKFHSWIWQDEDRIWEIEEAYNKMFAVLEPKKYKSSRNTFPEMSPSIQLYDYQKDAVEHIINEKNTLLAFDVGAGKTYIMIAAAMEMRRMGLKEEYVCCPE
ncbi:MAG: sce7726 family protein [Ruminococcus sp.]|nr:sce7726 family protein [Ruminococcus sp.]